MSKLNDLDRDKWLHNRELHLELRRLLKTRQGRILVNGTFSKDVTPRFYQQHNVIGFDFNEDIREMYGKLLNINELQS